MTAFASTAFAPPLPMRPAADPERFFAPLFSHSVRAGFPSPADDYAAEALDYPLLLGPFPHLARRGFPTANTDSARTTTCHPLTICRNQRRNCNLLANRCAQQPCGIIEQIVVQLPIGVRNMRCRQTRNRSWCEVTAPLATTR